MESLEQTIKQHLDVTWPNESELQTFTLLRLAYDAIRSQNAQCRHSEPDDGKECYTCAASEQATASETCGKADCPVEDFYTKCNNCDLIVQPNWSLIKDKRDLDAQFALAHVHGGLEVLLVEFEKDERLRGVIAQLISRLTEGYTLTPQEE